MAGDWLMIEMSPFAIRQPSSGTDSVLRLAEPRNAASMRAPRRELSPATPGLPTTRPDSYLTDLAATPLWSRPHASARDVGATLHSHAGGVTFDDRLVVPHFSTTPHASSNTSQ